MTRILQFFILALIAPTISFAKVKIGFIEAFSGADPHTARELFRGSEAYLGFNPDAAKNIEVIRYDLGGSVAETANTIQKALKDGIRVFVGAGKSDDAIAIAKLLDGQAIFITPFATNAKVTKDKSTVFRVCFSDDAQGEGLAEFATGVRKAKTVTILRNVQSSYSIGLSETFMKFFKGSTSLIEYSGESMDASLLASSIIKSKPELVFLPDHITRASIIAKAIHARDKTIKFLGGDGFGGQKMFLGVMGAEKDIELTYSTHWHPEIRNKENANFKNSYLKIYPEDVPTSGAAMTFDAFAILNEALKEAGYKTDISKLVSILESRNFKTTTGQVSFPKSKDHSPQKPLIFLQYKNGEYGISEDQK